MTVDRSEAHDCVVEACELVDADSGIGCFHLADEDRALVAAGSSFDTGEVNLHVRRAA